MGVPMAAPPLPPQGYPPPPPPQLAAKRGGTSMFVLAGIAGAAGLFVAMKGSALHSDASKVNNAMIALFVLAAVLAAIGVSRRK
jgi:hypothetical protein